MLGGAAVSLAGLIIMVCLASDAGNTAAMGALWVFWMAGAVGIAALVVSQFKAVISSQKITSWLLYLFICAVLVFMAAFAQSSWSRVAEALSPAGAVACGLLPWVHALAFLRLRVRTAEGQAKLDQLRGFRLFLRTTAKGRLKLLNPPEKTPVLFEKYLPFAVALEAIKPWSAQFILVLADAAGDRQTHTPGTPGWYLGKSWNSINWLRFTTNFTANFTAAISTAANALGNGSGSTGNGGERGW